MNDDDITLEEAIEIVEHFREDILAIANRDRNSETVAIHATDKYGTRISFSIYDAFVEAEPDSGL